MTTLTEYYQSEGNTKSKGAKGTHASSSSGSMNPGAVSKMSKLALDMMGMPNNLGQASGVASGVAEASQGSNPGKVAQAALTTAGLTTAGKYVSQLAGPFTGLAMNTGLELTKEDPNIKASSVRSIPGVVGGAVSMVNPIAGIAAGALTSYFVNSAMPDGWAGDWGDTRSWEALREEYRDEHGYSYQDTADIMYGSADTQESYTGKSDSSRFNNPSVSNYDPMADNPSATPQGTSSPNSVKSSLQGYYDSLSEKNPGSESDKEGGIGYGGIEGMAAEE